jgi:imidazoleglycerol-phosphate dehydratase/histidinol-phosphatase
VNTTEGIASNKITAKEKELDSVITLQSTDWKVIYEFLKLESRSATISRKTMKRTYTSI